MQKHAEKTGSMFFATEQDVFRQLVVASHPFRQLLKVIDFVPLIAPLRALYSDLGTTGFDVEKGFKALLIQFWEDYSDRQMEQALRENIAVKFFCGFGLTEATPVYTYFTKLRTRLGAKRLANAFNAVNIQLRSHGLFGDTFAFVDASAIITKTALWDERDRAIADGYEKLDNAVVAKYAADKDARWGRKGKHDRDVWFGYKRHHAVDMRHGLIVKVAVTPANVLDYDALHYICPEGQMVFMDKLYDCTKANSVLQANRCASGQIRKDNNKRKNADLDRWRSHRRMPFEGNFSKLHDRARYRGRTKVLFQCFAQAMVHNLKKAVMFLPRTSCTN